MLRLCYSRVCSSQTGIIRKYHIFMCRQCFRDQAHLIGFRKVRLPSALSVKYRIKLHVFAPHLSRKRCVTLHRHGEPHKLV